MAKEEFIQNLRVAGNLRAHRVPAHHSNKLDSKHSHAGLWLSPASVRGFDAADFPELSGQSLAELEGSIRRFGEVAAQVPLGGEASSEQEAAARAEFENILRIVEAHFPKTEEIRALRSAMEEVHFPEGVLTWDFEFGRDSSGDPAVWIWIVVDDILADDPVFAAATTRFAREIREALQRAGSDRWPYVRFRTASEQKELQTIES